MRAAVGIAFGICAALALGADTAGAEASRADTYDILIKNARILDGSGNPWFSGIIAVKDGHIAAIGNPAGPLSEAAARRVIDATGLVAAPGFIDLHTHSDMPLLADGNGESMVRDGVTLNVMGEASSVAPRDGLPPEGNGPVRQDWTTFTGYFDRLRKGGISLNVISHVAEDQLRRVVMGYSDADPTPEQLAKMEALMARSMQEGAWGLVTLYDSGGPAHPDEAIALAKVAARYGGNYTSHIGGEGYQEEQELDFAFRVAREAHIPVHIFHLYASGKPVWGRMPAYLDMIEKARSQGLDITANQYAYTAKTHPWSLWFPTWSRAGGPKAFGDRLQDPAVLERIKHDKQFIDWSTEHGGWEGIVVARVNKPENRKYLGKTVVEVAKMMGEADPADAALKLQADEHGQVSGIYFALSEDNVKMVMQKPWVAVASDGAAINLDAPPIPHPRSYSNNARVLGHYVREEHTLTLPEAVRKMTGLPAQILGLTDRGLLKTGYWADITLFDPATVGETNTYEHPQSYPKGIPYVMVNGVLVVDHGRHTGARPGMPLMGKGYEKS
ncbi:MAG TPA: D-aminoacylase [Rhizomicrobium sp.]|nr:D-aminoacylase [Rhizomicrobium sp.]